MQEETVVYVSGINKYANEFQIFNFFKSISKEVLYVVSQGLTFDNQAQIAKVYVKSEKEAEYIIDTVNFNIYDGVMMRAHIENMESAKARFNEEANVCIRLSDNALFSTERELYIFMRYFGKVLSVKVISDKNLGFCQFYSKEDADKVCQNNFVVGLTFSKKTSKKQIKRKQSYTPRVTRHRFNSGVTN